jgi:hypothetical protein
MGIGLKPKFWGEWPGVMTGFEGWNVHFPWGSPAARPVIDPQGIILGERRVGIGRGRKEH